MKLHLIAKTAISLTAIVCSVMSAPIAQSTTLTGHLEKLQPATIGGEFTIGLSRTDCFPDEYQGLWQCETVVTDSAVDTVLSGQKVGSQVNSARIPRRRRQHLETGRLGRRAIDCHRIQCH